MLFPVQPALQDCVESIFILDWDATRYSFDSVYTYPWSVTSHIFITIHNEPSMTKPPTEGQLLDQPQNFIIGPRLLKDTVDLGQRRHIVGIAFKPGGITRLSGIPVCELVNNRIDASLVWGNEINRLADRLKNAKSNHEIFMITELFLLQKATGIKPLSVFDRAINELIRTKGNLSVKTVADYAGLSIRQLQRKSLHILGISPKLFAKIMRFTSACIYKEAHPAMPWYRIAYEFGYADQMHMIHDFKIFSGATPTAMDLRIRNSDPKLITTLEGKIR
ncbi:helix-turn-helix domain-containing protein [Parapedobacter sp. 10938]|uniref:helix-turn-helix domain-containing protein n=1 Tax=Parapedobacter flavus TaxID=3110225 RepID=UPI002DB8F61B|nr:helix-turn-helix domain-containing protein [Parapedobacter sp. 10938]MEC3880204.1 helix-turn-helix domain-containing protein [Parapedobacter sp. 10938]